MKKQLASLCVAGLVLSGAIACSPKVAKSSEPIVTLSSELDSAAYALGVINGNGFRQSLVGLPGDSLDRARILEGFTTGMMAQEAKISLEQAQAFVQAYIKKVQTKELEELKSRNDSVLLANKSKDGVHTTESGLQYRVLRPATGSKPTVQDTVVAHYVGKTIDGKEFDSSYKRGEPATFALLQVIPGWTEGLCLMEKGSKYELYIPASLGYGERGAGRDIPPHATLIFEIELIDIKPYVEPVPIVEPKAEKSTPKGKKKSK